CPRLISPKAHGEKSPCVCRASDKVEEGRYGSLRPGLLTKLAGADCQSAIQPIPNRRYAVRLAILFHPLSRPAPVPTLVAACNRLRFTLVHFRSTGTASS